jgi:RNA polymerase subunit RPABC4/transcription elongation factor Spt4
MKNCPKCNETLLDTHFGCPVCNIELVPSTAQKEAHDLVILCTVLNEAKAHIMRGFLESEGIPCQLENISFHAEPAPVADLMKVRLWTLKEDTDEARRLLQERESVQVCSGCVKEVDVQDEICPHCGERLEEC